MALSTASDPLPQRNTLASGIGELVGHIIRERVKRRVALEGRDLGGDRLGDFSPAVADRAIPEARNSIDVLATGVVPDQRSGASDEVDEALLRGLRERVQERAGHLTDASGGSPPAGEQLGLGA